MEFTFPRYSVDPLPGFHEPFSAISHLLAALWFLMVAPFLLRRGAGNWLRLISLGVYSFSCVFLMSMSAVFHMMVIGGGARNVMSRLDHSAIFVLIAGTFTPAFAILFQGVARWGSLVAVWTATVTAITLKVVFFQGFPEWLSLSLYLALGWIGLIAAVNLWRRFGYPFVRPLLLGGVCYSIGSVMEYLQWFVVVPGVVGPHELFHVLVVAGAMFHWQFVWQFANRTPLGYSEITQSGRFSIYPVKKP